jgi:hypothetical protein
MRFRHVLALLAVMFCHHGIARAQIITVEQIGDKTFVCMHSGLTSDLKDCGTRADWYSYVFVGSISGIASIEGDEKALQIVPEEVFLGTPPIVLTVLTSQAPCLPDLKVGDRWLFYLRIENNQPIVLDYYGNDSLPAERAAEQIDTLRRLKTIGNFGILRGDVVSGTWGDRQPVPDMKITATREGDELQFKSHTDENGKYEFPPVPPGRYKILGTSGGSFEPDENGAHVVAGACWHVTLSRSPHAGISGHVKYSNGLPADGVAVTVLRADGTQYASGTTYTTGDFAFDSLQAGDFVVELDFFPDADAPDGKGAGNSSTTPLASVFYPGVENRASATVIHLGADEKRNDINITIPVR